MGGTFDPIHNGHISVARAAASCEVDKVVLVPVRHPPHKSREDIVDPYHRYAMAALAVSGARDLTVSPYEVAREGSSYTIDTVRHFVSAGHDVALVMGSDSLAELPTWRECHELLERARAIVYPRRPLLLPQLRERLPDWIASKWDSGWITLLELPPIDTSSSEIRAMLRAGRSVDGLVPPAAAAYIAGQGLYAEGAPD